MMGQKSYLILLSLHPLGTKNQLLTKNLKSDNLQYNTVGRWVDKTIVPSKYFGKDRVCFIALRHILLISHTFHTPFIASKVARFFEGKQYY